VDKADKNSVAEFIRKSPANYEYFFSKLDDPAWLEMLRETGFFRAPPGAERDGDWIRFPTWPESQYLIRVAAQAPDEVAEIVKEIPDTDNPRIHEDVLQIAAELPSTTAAQVARKESKWLRSYDGNLVSLPSAVPPLLVNLAENEQIETALELAGVFLAVTGKDEPLGGRRPTAKRLEEYEFTQLIKNTWPDLVKIDPRRALSFLRDRLGDATRSAEDGLTTFWRSAIEDHAQNTGYGILDALVDALRDFSLIVIEEQGDWELVLSLLDDEGDPIFQRIALFLIDAKGSVEQVAEILGDHTLAYDVDFWHEYGELLRARFGELDEDQRAGVLATLARGPELEMKPWQEERGDTDEDLKRMESISQFRRYTLIAGQLYGEEEQRYETWREEFGEAEHPTFLSYMSSWSGPTSPYTEAELSELEPAELVERLHEWVPSGEPDNPSPEGLGRITEKVVAEKPFEYAAIAKHFAGLDSTYVRSYLSGLTEAVKAGRSFDWKPVVDLSAWVMKQTGERERTVHMTRDPHWGWARKQVASLLSQGFGESDAEALHELRDAIWTLIVQLAEDADPTPEQEQRDDGTSMEPAMLAINSTRGEAIHAAIRYVLWVERAAGDTRQPLEELAPEAKELLEQHMDPSIDPSLAIHSIYGQWFPQFVRLDKQWADTIAPQVFPIDPEQDTYFAAAWSSYIRFNRPYTDVFDVIRSAYFHATEKLGEEAEPTAGRDGPNERLGDHLIALRMLDPTTDDAGELLEKFWPLASSQLRKQLINRAGWGLKDSPNLSESFCSRITALWERIFEKTYEQEPGALASFGAWLEAPALDGAWLLTQALAVLELGIHLEPNFAVYGALARFAPDHPQLVVDVLRGMVTTDTEGWSLLGETEETHKALEHILANANPETRKKAEDLVHLLGARGMTEFRDLVSESSAGETSIRP
jgi:hypothetical protein